MFRQATPEERKRYYSEEWDREDVPDFIVDSIKKREFGFDHDGLGPRDRYNTFNSIDELADFLKNRSPFAAYCSVSLYEYPKKRENWERAELVFDIDAKDLPVKNCCGEGMVCEVCLNRAKNMVMEIDTNLKQLKLENVYYVYSGRGYHIRILDTDIMEIGEAERGFILDYIRASVPVRDESKTKKGRDPTLYSAGYTGIFRSRFADIIEYAEPEDFKEFGLGTVKAGEIIRNRDAVVEDLRKGRDRAIRKIIKDPRAYKRFEERVTVQISKFLDAKVTVDIKRILRLPSSLHSKVSMKCMVVEDLERFDPLRYAVPEFVDFVDFADYQAGKTKTI